MRKASDILLGAWNRYQTDGHFQDIVKTLGMAGIAAGGQELFPDMSHEEIAFSTLLGAGAGLAARPLLARGGNETELDPVSLPEMVKVQVAPFLLIICFTSPSSTLFANEQVGVPDPMLRNVTGTLVSTTPGVEVNC